MNGGETVAAIEASGDAVIHGTRWTDLTLLYDPAVMLVTAPTLPSPGALEHAERLAASGIRTSTVQVPMPDGAPEAGVLDRLTLKGEEHAQAWVSYLEQITELFGNLLGARLVGVRQIVADGPHCSRFHVDRVLARGVLSVLGPCTEWLNDADLDRTRLGHAGGSDDATSGLVRDWSGLERAENGKLAVFKGTAWPEAKDRAVVHRSPPANGQRRLILTLDCLE